MGMRRESEAAYDQLLSVWALRAKGAWKVWPLQVKPESSTLLVRWEKSEQLSLCTLEEKSEMRANLVHVLNTMQLTWNHGSMILDSFSKVSVVSDSEAIGRSNSRGSDMLAMRFGMSQAHRKDSEGARFAESSQTSE